jgi:hypothetical protein
MSYAIKESIKGELETALKNGETLEEIDGNSHEGIDGYLPVYYNEIVRQWQDLPSEYNDRGRAELGAGDDFTIYSLMSLDLYLYYTDLFNEVIAELEGEAGE